MKMLSAQALDLRGLVRAGDAVIFGQGTAEPETLTRALVAQRGEIGRLSVWLGVGFSRTFGPEHADWIHFSGMGGLGVYRNLTKAGCLDVVPCHLSQVADFIADGTIACDVAMVQVAPADRNGRYSFSLGNDYVRAAVEKARVVIAEVNLQAPRTACERPLEAAEIDFLVETDRPLLQVPAAAVGDTERRIASHLDQYIGDGATLQVGIGAIPEAILGMLEGRRNLGVHSGMIGDAVVDLMEKGIITNSHKGMNPGVTVTGVLIGTDRLYRFADDNRALKLFPTAYTHGAAILRQVRKIVSINSALEVDLTGQVNAEAIGADYVGAVGGQVDFVRGAGGSEGGVSIIALPSVTKGGVTRVVARLNGPVTTARSDVDVLATEHGAVRLKGMSLRRRVEAMISLAAPEHREALREQAIGLRLAP